MNSETVRLSERVVRVLAPNPSAMTLEGTNTYVVGDESTVIVIDPGPADAQHLGRVIKACGSAGVAGIFLTHWHGDHAEGAEKLAQTMHAPLCSYSPLGPEEVRLPDGKPAGAEGVFLVPLHTPGHSSDHLCFWLEEERALFSGDHVLGRGTSVVAHPDGDMAAYMGSLETIARKEPRVIYPGHGPVIEDPMGTINHYIAHRITREAQVLGALPGTPEEIVERLYTDVPAELHPIAAMSVRAHLEKLRASGEATEQDDTWSRA